MAGMASSHGTHPILTDNAATDEGPVIGQYIIPEASTRSGLLSGIASTTGQAPLPESVSPDDWQLWQAACAQKGPPSTEELITILKVRNSAPIVS